MAGISGVHGVAELMDGALVGYTDTPSCEGLYRK